MDTVFRDLELESKPDFVASMKRIYAWYDGEILDRAPVRFSAHNEAYGVIDENKRWKTLKDRWFDTEYQVESFIKRVENNVFQGETFPIFFPNIGPNFFGASLGGELEFGEVTSWMEACVEGEEDLDKIYFRPESEYYKKILELMDYALERCEHRFMVAYTDMHPSLDCACAFRGTGEICMDMYDEAEFVDRLVKKCFDPFLPMMDVFHKRLESEGQLYSTWMEIPFYDTMHIPSCDLGAMISPEFFNRFALPYIKEEVKHFRYNIFHLDGKGVAKHVDELLKLPQIGAIQWVQGVGNDRPIMQWIDFIKKIQAAGKSLVIDLMTDELEPFLDCMSPKGIYLCVPEKDPENQKKIIDRLLRWK